MFWANLSSASPWIIVEIGIVLGSYMSYFMLEHSIRDAGCDISAHFLDERFIFIG